MDVIGNNIANVNTVGFKSSRVTFKEAFVQLVSGASRPSSTLGGTNPIQVGTGVSIGSIDQLFSQGSLETTGQPLDLAIQGDALFVMNSGQGNVFTRVGNFQLDADGNLINPGTGYVAQGLVADAFGKFSGTSAIGNIHIGLTDKAPAQATNNITLTNNLRANAAVGEQQSMAINVYDSSGATHKLTLQFTNTGLGQWDWSASCPDAAVTPAGNGTVTFSPSGAITGFTYPAGGSNITLTPAGSGLPFNIKVNAGTMNGLDGLVSFAADSSNAVVNGQDGYPAGDLVNVTVDTAGVVTGVFNNGKSRALAQIALATFNNPAGLVRSSNGMFQDTPNSGTPVIGFVGGSSRSTITPGALEGSNVDISTEFTNMIITQRGFQANSKVVTTCDEILNDLVNMRR
jgi:flagellar hook protein FlgE